MAAIATGEAMRDFKFQSSPIATIITRGFGVGIIWFFSQFLAPWLSPSWDKLPYMILSLPVVLPFCFAGGFLALNTCGVEIAAGVLRFRRPFARAWISVHLESISKIRLLLGVVYLRAEHEGRRYRIIFSPHQDYFGHRPLSVFRFLQEIAKQNEDSG